MLDQHVADRTGLAGSVRDHVEHSRGQTGLAEDLGPQQAADVRRELGGLQHHRVAQGNRRGQRARGEDERGIPGRDRPDHSDGAPHAHGEGTGVRRDDLSHRHVRERGCLAEEARHEVELEHREAERAAGLLREPGAGLVAAALEEVGCPEEDPLPLGGRRLRPGGKGAGGGLDGRTGVVGSSRRDSGDHVSGERIEIVERRPAGALDPLAADEEPALSRLCFDRSHLGLLSSSDPTWEHCPLPVHGPSAHGNLGSDLSNGQDNVLDSRNMTTVETGGAAANGRYSQSLERGLAILSSFTASQSLLGISDLARMLGLTRSTTHRYVSTLVALGYLEQDLATRRYRLGPRVIDLGLSAINSMELREISLPHLQQLSDETGNTVNMAILDGADVVYVERCRSSRHGQRDIDLNLHVGSRMPSYCTSMGKVLLAYLPEDRLEALLADMRLTKRGPNTITSRSALRAELARVRAAGLAVNNEELAFGLRSIAVPVHGANGAVAAAVNLAVHRSWVSIEDLVAQYGPALKRTAAAIAGRAGYRPA
jgi:IclR family pca regulon transcriptional regulator